MSRTLLLKGPHDLIEEIIGTLDMGKNDFSDTLIIFPGKRPPHFLKKSLAVKKGAPIIPPACYSMETFVDGLYREHLKRKNRPIEACDAVSVLHDLYVSDCPVKLPSDLSGDFDRFLPVGFRLLEALEEMRIENISWDVNFDSFTDEPKILKCLYRPFYEFLEKNNRCTRASIFRDVAEHIAETELNFNRILFAGFFTLTSAEAAIIRHFLKRPDFLLFLQDGTGIEDIIDKLGVKPEEKPFPPRSPEIRLYQGADAHEEIFMLNTILQKTGKMNLTNERHVIVLPSQENLFPVLRNGLSDFKDDEYNISLGYPLIRTPAAAFLNLILEAVSGRQGERFFAADYLSLILHPYAKNTKTGDGRTDITRVMCHTIEEKFFKENSRRYFMLEDIEKNDALFEKIMARIRNMESGMTAEVLKNLLKTIHDRTLKPFLQIRNIADFADKCLDVITYLNDETTANRHPFFNQFVEPLVKAVESMKGDYTGDKSFASPESYRRLLYYYLRAAQKSFPGTPVKGLQVLGLLETRNLTFDRAFVLDVNEDILPPAPGADPFLPPAIRSALKLNAPDHAQKTASYYFNLLKQNTRELYLFYVNNNDTVRSRFIEEYLWEKQKECGKIDIERDLIRKGVGTFRLSRSKPEPITKNDEISHMLKQFTYSASMLKTYLACGLQFYYKYVLNLSEKETPDDTIDALDIGDFVHDVLRKYFADKKSKPLTPDILKTDGLDAIIAEEFEKNFGYQESGQMLLIQNQVRRRVKEFIENYQRNIPAEIIELEAEKEADFESYKLKGRLDRVEKRGGKLYIIDYKTSPRQNTRSALNNFDPCDPEKLKELIQLAVYWIICSMSYDQSPEEIVPAYIFLGDTEMDAGCEVSLIRPGADAGQQFEEYKAKLKELLGQITDTAIPFMPPEEEKFKDHCPRCEYNTLCGTQWIGKAY